MTLFTWIIKPTENRLLKNHNQTLRGLDWLQSQIWLTSAFMLMGLLDGGGVLKLKLEKQRRKGTRECGWGQGTSISHCRCSVFFFCSHEMYHNCTYSNGIFRVVNFARIGSLSGTCTTNHINRHNFTWVGHVYVHRTSISHLSYTLHLFINTYC